VKVVEDQRDVALLGELVDEPRKPDLAQRRCGDRGGERLAREGRARPGERLDDVGPQDHRVVIAIVERHPRGRTVLGLALPPGGQQRGLAESGRAGDEAEPEPAAGAQPREQPLALDDLRRDERRVQLRDEEDRSARDHARLLPARAYQHPSGLTAQSSASSRASPRNDLMTRSIRRGACALSVLALSAFAAPAANASPGVCNQASPHWLGGGLVALDPPVNSPAARYTVDIGKLPGKGAGLFEAAANSPSLTVCDGGGGGVDPSVVVIPDDGGSVDVGDGVISAS